MGQGEHRGQSWVRFRSWARDLGAKLAADQCFQWEGIWLLLKGHIKLLPLEYSGKPCLKTSLPLVSPMPRKKKLT